MRRCHIDQIRRREEVHENVTGTKDGDNDTGSTRREVTDGMQSNMEESEEADVESHLEIIPPSETTHNDENTSTANDGMVAR